MTAPDDLIRCIYCTELRPRSREHALQRGLGGDLVAPISCKPRNNGFSNIDGALARHSLVALDRVAQTPAEAFDVELVG